MLSNSVKNVRKILCEELNNSRCLSEEIQTSLVDVLGSWIIEIECMEADLESLIDKIVPENGQTEIQNSRHLRLVVDNTCIPKIEDQK